MNKSILVPIASLGRIGYLPGSGTIASLIMIPIIYLFHYFQISLVFQALFIVVLAVISFIIISKILPFFIDKDPSLIVLDECVGMLIATFALPISVGSVFLAFITFRLLDISKFFGVILFERLPGAWGVLLDDIVAALVTNILLRLIVPLVCP